MSLQLAALPHSESADLHCLAQTQPVASQAKDEGRVAALLMCVTPLLA